MQIELAIGSILILMVNFAAEKFIKHRCRKTQEKEPQAGETKTSQNLAAVRLRNQRLARLSLLTLILLLFLQSVNIKDVLNKQKKHDMNDLESRIIKIEKFLWGNGGSASISGGPPGPQDGQGYIKTLENRVAELTEKLEALGVTVTEIIHTMKVPVQAHAQVER